MFVIIDTHIHLYPSYDLSRFFHSAFRAMERFTAGALSTEKEVVAAIALTERFDCHAFQDLWEGTLNPPAGFTVKRLGERSGLQVASKSGQQLLVIPGRQLVTSEGLELIAQGRDLAVPDGLPLRESFARVVAEGAFPVLPWSPGKWWSRRGRVLENFLAGLHPGQIALGDIAMRPFWWREPSPMKLAREQGFQIIYGSDPLPFAGEEAMVGRYVSACSGSFDLSVPGESLVALLSEGSLTWSALGERCSTAQFLLRTLMNQLSKSPSSTH